MATIQIKRGVKTLLPATGLLVGEPLFVTDKGSLYIATSATTSTPISPVIDELPSLGGVSADDLLIMHDTSADLSKNITFAAFKDALSIPTGSTDEKVAIINGGTSNYIWGTDGSDGVIRAGASLLYTKAADSSYVTLSVKSIDGGEFV